MKCDFSIRHYKATLKLAKKLGYSFSTMENYEKNRDKPMLIVMRHDVDFSLGRALILAKIENKLDIPSTFFFRVHSKTYGLDANFKKIVKKIIELGHEIGLHSENLDFAHLEKKDPTEVIKKEKQVLEEISGIHIKGVAPHQDFTGINNLDFWKDHSPEEFDFEYQAYEDKFTKEMKYISESLCNWREGCMHTFVEKKIPKLLILTHPVYWYKKKLV